jgi:hypothetical protein
MKEVGYHHFEYGVPGNLIPLRLEDCLELAHPAFTSSCSSTFTRQLSLDNF